MTVGASPDLIVSSSGESSCDEEVCSMHSYLSGVLVGWVWGFGYHDFKRLARVWADVYMRAKEQTLYTMVGAMTLLLVRRNCDID